MSDRQVRFSGNSWQEIEALPVTIWYVVAPYQGQEIISIQLVRLDT